MNYAPCWIGKQYYKNKINERTRCETPHQRIKQIIMKQRNQVITCESFVLVCKYVWKF